MMKLLWIPITLFLASVVITLMTSLGTHSSSGYASTLQAFIGQGLMIPFFFFILLFMWKFSRKPADEGFFS